MIFAPSGGGGGVNVWVTSTVYAAGDIVYYGKILYLCVTAHTSAAAFETDLAATKWRPLSQQVINYISDVDGASIGKWVTYADAAGTAPVDGTGGAANSTFAVSTSTALRGTTNFLFTKNSGASRQGEGFSYDFFIDPSDQSKVLQVSFEYLITSAAGTYVDNDLSVWIYDVTNAALIQPAPTYLKNSNLIEKYACEFQTSSSSTSYRLIVHIGGTTNSTATIRFANFNVGPQAKLYGSNITDWVSYTPTITHSSGGITNNTNTFFYRRQGDSMEIRGHISFSAASAAFNTLWFSLPAGLSIDSSKIASTTSGRVMLGESKFLDDTVQHYGPGTVVYNTSTTMEVLYSDIKTHTGTAPLLGDGISNTLPFTYGASDSISIYAKAPILGWSSSVVMSSDADTRVVAAQMTSTDTPTFATGTPTKATWSATVTDSHGMADLTNDRFNILVPGDYRFSANYFFSSIASTANGSIQMSARVNGTATYIMGAQGFASGVTQYRGFAGVTLIRNLKAGDYVELVINQDIVATLTALNILNHFDIERISGPAQIAASETVSALYTGAPPTGTLNSTPNTVTYGTKVKDSHGAYSSGSYTIPSAGQYDIGAVVDITHVSITVNSYTGISIYVDGVQKYVRYVWCQSASVLEYHPSIDVKAVPLLAGQVVTIRPFSTGTTPSYVSNAPTNNFYINRSGTY